MAQQVAGPEPRATVAVDPPPGEEERDPWTDGKGARISAGLILIEEHSGGGYGRLELESFAVKPSHEGMIGGVLFGIEGWGAEGSGGGGFPFLWYGGFRGRQSIFATIGFGWSWAIYDRVDGDGGFGIFAPTTGVAMGGDFESVRVLLEGRAQYRWQWGADDRFQLQAGLTIGFTDLH
jgi:hypothetical protein